MSPSNWEAQTASLVSCWLMSVLAGWEGREDGEGWDGEEGEKGEGSKTKEGGSREGRKRATKRKQKYHTGEKQTPKVPFIT